MRRRLVRLVLVLLVVLAVAAVLVTQVVAIPGGPLEGGGDVVSTQRFGPGARVTVQAFALRNKSGRTLELEDVDIGRLEDRLRVLGIDVTPRRLPGAGVQPGYPPSAGAGVLREVEGAQLRRRAVLVIGVQVRGGGRIADVEVRYRDRGILRRAELDGAVVFTVR